MNGLKSEKKQCPYCGELIRIIIDCSVPHQNYIEDCQVCCRPITFDVTVDEEGTTYVSLFHENE